MGRRLGMAALAAFGLAAGAARADVIYQDFDPANPTYIGGLFITGPGVSVFTDDSAGLIFSPTKDAQLGAVEVWAQPAVGVAGFPAGPYDAKFDLSLYAGAGSVPGSLIEDLGVLDAGGGRSLLTATSALHPALSAGSTYFLVATGADANSAILLLGSQQIGTVYGDVNGLQVTNQTNRPAAYITSYAAAVPEPAALASLGVGLAGLGLAGLAGLRRQARATPFHPADV